MRWPAIVVFIPTPFGGMRRILRVSGRNWQEQDGTGVTRLCCGSPGAGDQRTAACLVLEPHARGSESSRREDEPGDLGGGVGAWQALGPDVRHAIAVGVQATDARRKREVGAKAVGR